MDRPNGNVQAESKEYRNLRLSTGMVMLNAVKNLSPARRSYMLELAVTLR